MLVGQHTKATMVVAAFAAVLGAVGVYDAHANAPTPGGAPSSLAAGPPKAPSEVTLDLATGVIGWVDNSDNESGFRVEYTANAFTASYEVDTDITSFTLPPGAPLPAAAPPFDARHPCGGLFRVAVFARNVFGESEPGERVVVLECYFPVPVPAPSAIPIRLISTDRSVSAIVREDTDLDGAASPGDQPAATRADLQTHARLQDGSSVPTSADWDVIFLFTAADGSLRFENLPPGGYVLWVWGRSIGIPPSETNPNLFLAEISVDSDGSVSGAVPAEFLMEPLPPGQPVRYPVTTGTGAGPIPVGSVDVAQARGAQGGVSLPDTGDGGPAGGGAIALAGAVAIAAALLAAGLAALKKRR
jgi:hypothetical protein